MIGEHPGMEIPDRRAKEEADKKDEKDAIEAKEKEDEEEEKEEKDSDPVATKSSLKAYDTSNEAEHEAVQAEIRHGPSSTSESKSPSSKPDTNSNSNTHLDDPSQSQSQSPTSITPSQTSQSQSQISNIVQHLNAGAQDTQATIQDSDIAKGSTGEFSPHIMHKAHKPVPIVMVNRVPRGSEYTFNFKT